MRFKKGISLKQRCETKRRVQPMSDIPYEKPRYPAPEASRSSRSSRFARLYALRHSIRSVVWVPSPRSARNVVESPLSSRSKTFSGLSGRFRALVQIHGFLASDDNTNIRTSSLNTERTALRSSYADLRPVPRISFRSIEHCFNYRLENHPCSIRCCFRALCPTNALEQKLLFRTLTAE